MPVHAHHTTHTDHMFNHLKTVVSSERRPTLANHEEGSTRDFLSHDEGLKVLKNAASKVGEVVTNAFVSNANMLKRRATLRGGAVEPVLNGEAGPPHGSKEAMPSSKASESVGAPSEESAPVHKDQELIHSMSMAAAASISMVAVAAQRQVRNSLHRVSFGGHGKDSMSQPDEPIEESLSPPAGNRMIRSTLATLAAADLHFDVDDMHDDAASPTTGAGEHLNVSHRRRESDGKILWDAAASARETALIGIEERMELGEVGGGDSLAKAPNETQKKKMRDLSSIYLFNSPLLFKKLFDTGLLFNCFYLSVFVSNYLLVSLQYGGSEGALYFILCVLPSALIYPCLISCVRSYTIVRSVGTLDSRIVGQVIDETEEQLNVQHEVFDVLRGKMDMAGLVSTDIRKVFDEMDINRDGVLDEHEMRSSLVAVGIHLSNSKFKRLFNFIDKDKSGFVEYNEFFELAYPDETGKKYDDSSNNFDSTLHSQRSSRSSPRG